MINKIEELSINAWPALSVQMYDGWMIRASNGYTRRANSVTVIGKSEIPLDEKIAYCEKYYERLGLPAIFKIVEGKSCEELEEKLCNLSYIKAASTSVRIKELSDNDFGDNENIAVEHRPSDEWIDAYFEHSGKDTSLKGTYASIVRKIKNTGIWATYRQNGKAAGFAFAVTERNCCGIYNLFVCEESRGRGYGKAIMDKLLRESVRLGADLSYLQVEEGNCPAKSLYDKMGYSEIYRYHYRKSR